MAIWQDGVALNDVYTYFKDIVYSNNKNSYYTQNNWVKEIKIAFAHTLVIPDSINIIKRDGGAIWLTADGDICYRFSPIGKVRTANIAKINLLFSNFLNCNFKITPIITKTNIFEEDEKKSQDEKKLQNDNELTISIGQLLLVEAEEFNPFETKEFYLDHGLMYHNIFQPSRFLQNSPTIMQNGVPNIQPRSLSDSPSPNTNFAIIDINNK